MATKKQSADATQATLPDTVTLASPYGFFDDDETFQSWSAGQVVTDPAHIELLIARGAPLAE